MDKDWLQALPVPTVTVATPVSGGDVNQAWHLQTQDGQDYFLLVQPGQPGSFYDGEVAGLRAFADADVLAPRVVAQGTIARDGFLLLTYLTSGRGSQRDLGRLVARLHAHRSPNGQFGFDQPYAGTSISFTNRWVDSWIQLFVEERLDRLAAQLLRKRLWVDDDMAQYQRARSVVVAALREHKSEPVLLHGDLWSGNFMFTQDGHPALIDPAAMYGDREFDIGVSTVFGGFAQDFYAAYQEALPLATGYEQRLPFYRLYLLMVHLDKFGRTYYDSVAQTLQTILAG